VADQEFCCEGYKKIWKKMHTTYTFKPEWGDLSPKPPVDPRMNEVHTSDIIKKLNLIILIVHREKNKTAVYLNK